MALITAEQLSKELKLAIKLTWRSKRLWYLGLLTSLLFSVETVPFIWGLRILLDTKGILSMWDAITQAILLSSGTTLEYLKITAFLALIIFLAINFLLALSAKTLIQKVNNIPQDKLFSNKGGAVFVVAVSLKLIALAVFTLFLWVLSYNQTQILRVLSGVVVFLLLFGLLTIGTLSVVKMVVENTGIFKSLVSVFRVFISEFYGLFYFFLLMTALVLFFSILLILTASVLILPLAVIGVIFYSTQMTAPFWGVVITSLILLSILLIFSTSFFTIIRVRLWNYVYLKSRE